MISKAAETIFLSVNLIHLQISVMKNKKIALCILIRSYLTQYRLKLNIVKK